VFGRTTETAIAALGCLAEAHGPTSRRSVEQIAAACGRRPPFLAKLLAALSRAGLVQGERGPGGGYRLARAPGEITLLEVYRLFEGELPGDECAWGGDCEGGEPCVLHEGVAEVRETTRRFLEETTLAAFQQAKPPGTRGAGRRRPVEPRAGRAAGRLASGRGRAGGSRKGGSPGRRR
jgi:Rrf2 family iron-sulfur cluster assembly transcriptional regulator